MKCDILIVSGLWNSGPEHWQTHWERKYQKWTRVSHRDWNSPDRDEWVAELDAAIAACEGRPILVAHSLGCMLVAQWAQSGSPLKAAGAFLVAPSDTEASSYPIDPMDFRPIPLAPLPFPSIVVASANDEYAHIERSRAFAAAWGSELVEIGDAGHINADSGFGPWPEGEALLDAFCRDLNP
ncbi:alpha/beta hydrolase [Massilia sp. YIM B02763]|uniref:RBBP9/YdeN family alpha/beta hydrolase n=1 Tax=Massilia sp. YIM B02763 TaxID=3050130 RepID=UPI0025B669C4|nr:alpha/beta hydrolase [Massilia sp. YIM B02763]MDN4052136.1 alpha/beta hydrolase [Massilia sp. YIM B02763]